MLQSCNSLTIRNSTKVESESLSETIQWKRPGTLNSRSPFGVIALCSWLALLPNLSPSIYYEDENLVDLVQTCSDSRQKCQSTSKAAKESIAKR